MSTLDTIRERIPQHILDIPVTNYNKKGEVIDLENYDYPPWVKLFIEVFTEHARKQVEECQSTKK